MALTFYPHSDDLQTGSLEERIELLDEAAERYRAVVLDLTTKQDSPDKKHMVPREQVAAYNWEEITKVLREIRDMAEISHPDRIRKADCLTKLAEIYEVLRAAKMSKLEAVRLALINEASQLRGGTAHVA